MATAVNDIVSQAKVLLLDNEQDADSRWPSIEMIDYLNQAELEIALQKPEASSSLVSMQLVAGTKQALPTGGLFLLDVIRNMGTDGATAGNIIRLIDRKILDAQVPDWHTLTGVSVIKHFAFDDRSPKNFYVYPPADGTSYVELLYSITPAVVGAGDDISLDDIYSNAILDYMLYRAYIKDSEYTTNANKAVAHLQAFQTSLGIRETVELINNPNLPDRVRLSQQGGR